MPCINCGGSFISNPAQVTAPPSLPCTRIATDQSSESMSLLEPQMDGGTVIGHTSGATGIVEGYIYEIFTTDPLTFQQYMVLSSVIGTFSDGEELWSDFFEPLDPPSWIGIGTRTTIAGGVDQTSVNCDTGTAPGEDRNDFTDNPFEVTHEDMESDREFEMAIVAVPVDLEGAPPDFMVGQASGAQAYFMGFRTSEVISGSPTVAWFSNYTPAPRTRNGFRPGERVLINGQSTTFTIANPSLLTQL